jgi:hypothetical protein
MSLDFDTSRIKDREVHFPADEQGKMNDALHVLIWNSLAIDIGRITEKNVDEVWYRTDMWQRLIGAQFNKWVPVGFGGTNEDGSEAGSWQPFLLTREDIVNAVGLHTNVSNSTRHQFIKKVTGRFHSR